MKYTIITALIMLTACAADPNGLRHSYDSKSVIVEIINIDEALRQINRGN